MSIQEESPARSGAARTETEEFANVLTHALGLGLSMVGAVVLVVCSLDQGDAWRALGCSIFAATMVALYATSTLSHAVSETRPKRLFRMLDQACIYLLIAGTYTPFALAFLRHGWWWLLFGGVWIVALLGFFSKILFAHRVDAVSIGAYVLLGWTPIIAGMPLSALVPAIALWGMLIGGFCYTFGTVFLIYDERFPHFHAIWHVFVLAGSACHYFSILFFVAQVG